MIMNRRLLMMTDSYNKQRLFGFLGLSGSAISILPDEKLTKPLQSLRSKNFLSLFFCGVWFLFTLLHHLQVIPISRAFSIKNTCIHRFVARVIEIPGTLERQVFNTYGHELCQVVQIKVSHDTDTSARTSRYYWW